MRQGYGKKMSQFFGGAGGSGSVIFKGEIVIPSDFPTLLEVQTGWEYIINNPAGVTDNDSTKTNTGLSFPDQVFIIWTGSTWAIEGGESLIADNGTDLIPVSTRGFNILSGQGYKVNGVDVLTTAAGDATSKANAAESNAESYADGKFLLKGIGLTLGYIPVVDNTGIASYQDAVVSDGATVDVSTNATTGVKTLSLNSGVTSLLPTTDEKAAMDGANSPSVTNVFATMSDIVTPANVDLTKVLFVNKFGNDLAELSYPAGSGSGFITLPSEFPATFVDKDCYMIPDGTTVTDNDPTKTNTGLTFVGPIQIQSDAANSTYISRDGKSQAKALCTIGAALYLNYFVSAPYPSILCFDNATYYFPSGSANYGSVFAPFATAQITGWHYLMRSGVTYFGDVQITSDLGSGCIMLNSAGSGIVYEYHAKRVFTTDATLSSSIFRNTAATSSLLEVYCGDLLATSSSQAVLVAQGAGGSPSRVSVTVNGKIKGRAVTINTGANLITITAGDKSELTTVEASGEVLVMANLDDVSSIGSPVSRVVFAGNTFITPNTITDGFRTSGDFIGAYSFLSSMGLGNDGTYHGAGIYGRLPMWNGSGVQTNYFTTVGGEDNLMTLPFDIRGGFKDKSLSGTFTAVKLADIANQSFTTTNKTIIGAVNEIRASSTISQQKDRFITTAGQTAFTSSATPVAVLGFCYKGVFYIDEGAGKDYTYTGTSFTWVNSGITFALNDVVFIVYNK